MNYEIRCNKPKKLFQSANEHEALRYQSVLFVTYTTFSERMRGRIGVTWTLRIY